MVTLLDGLLPLTAPQLEIWLAQQLDPASPRFNLGSCFEIHGLVDRDMFAVAMRQVMAETETMRVAIVATPDGPRQRLERIDGWSPVFIDASGEAEPRSYVESWMRSDLARPVDLGTGMLFCQALFELAPDRFIWYQRARHVITDGAGFSMIAQRVAEVYTCMVGGVEEPKTPFRPLTDLVAEDLEYQESADYRQDCGYWLGQLAGIPEPASAVARTARAARGSLVHRGNLPDEYVEGLHRLAPILRVNLPAVIVAGVANYLGGVTGNTDILLGLTTTGRSGAVARSTPGQVSNVVPLRLSVTPWTRTAELVGQTSARVREALAAQRFRGEALRRELGLGDDRSLVGWRVNVMPFKFDATFGGHRVVMRTLSTGPVDDVIVNVYTRIGVPGLQVDLEANPDLYTESELAAHHARLLTGLREMIEKADPDRPVARYPVATDTDRDRVLAPEWNSSSYPVGEQTIPDLIEAQVSRTPHAPAVVCRDIELTYAELNARANQLARVLVRHGVGPEKLVAVAVPRSPEMVVAVLAVLKAGAGYLPVDLDYPPERIALTLEDADVALMLTTSGAVGALPESVAAPRLLLPSADRAAT